ncbi:hypothetical protein D3C85_1921900 [compost metagenome]
MYIIGIPSLVCVGFIVCCGGLLVFKVYRMSNTYGEHGMMKAIASRQVPKCIKVYSRAVFFKI